MSNGQKHHSFFHRFGAAFLILNVFATILFSQSNRTVTHTLLTRTLVQQGYENVIARTHARTTLVQYEDSKNRYPTDGIRDVVGRTSLLLPCSTKNVALVLQKYGVPIVVFENADFASFYNQRRKRAMIIPQLYVSERTDLIIYSMTKYPSYNSSRLKTDLLFHPDFRMRLGNYNHPVETQFNIIPEFQTLLWPGLFLSASLVVPLHNDFDEWQNYIRVGPSSLNYFKRLLNNFFMYGTAGYFRGNRYGAEVGLKKYLLTGGLALDVRMGYSGYSIMDKGILKYDYLKDLTYSFSALYFIKRYRLFTSLGFHRFIYKDHGIRIEMFRFFNEFQFGLWGVYADESFNGGFKFSIPLPPRQYKSRGYFRPRVANYFDLTYQGKYNTAMGTTLKANEILDDLFLRYNPQYLKSNLGRAEAR